MKSLTFAFSFLFIRWLINELINWSFSLSILASKVFNQVNRLLFPFTCWNKICIVFIEIVSRFWFLFGMIPMAFRFWVLICKSILLKGALLVVLCWVLMFLLQLLLGLGFWNLISCFDKNYSLSRHRLINTAMPRGVCSYREPFTWKYIFQWKPDHSI